MINLTSKLILLVTLFISTISFAQTTGAIKGQVLNTDREPVIGATIKITSGGVLIGGTVTDVEGKYTYKPINAGVYELMVQSFETQTKRITKVEVNPEKTTYVDVTVSANTLSVVTVEEEYVKPVVDVSYITMRSISSEDFLHSANDRMDIKAMIVGVSSDISVDDNGDLHVRGSRGDASAYIIDGVRVENPNGFTALSVENLSVITGGIPAQYGDMTSGVVVVTTKDYFSGIRSKHMRQRAITERNEFALREQNAKKEEERRKKEIEEELKKEEEAKAKQP